MHIDVINLIVFGAPVSANGLYLHLISFYLPEASMTDTRDGASVLTCRGIK
jgi:hypothetical protein